MTGALEVRGLSVAFHRRAGLWWRETSMAVRDVDLTARGGELLALVGASGAGKSLLLHAILRLLPPEAVISGAVSLAGRQLDAASATCSRGRRIALVPQSTTYLDPLARVGHQLRWGARRLDARESAFDLAATLQAVGLAPEAGMLRPDGLSGGMARRVLLAAALSGTADVILADEPTDGLDHDNASLVLSRLRALADRGRAVVVVTHDLSGVLRFADRVAVMREGRVEAEEEVSHFVGDGERLKGDWSRQLWRALPQNGFIVPAARRA